MKVIKLYLRYFFTLTNVLIFSLLILFLTFSYFMSIYDINTNLSYELVIKSYYENSLYYSKIVVLFSVIFIFIKSFSERNEYVINFVLASGYKKEENYLYMIITNVIISFLFILILFMNFIMIGFIFKGYFYITKEMLKSFISLLTLSIYYGLFSFLLMMITNNQFIFLFIFVLSMLGDLIIKDSNILGKIYLFFFPTLIIESGNLSFNLVFLLFLICFLFILNGYIYVTLDLKN